VSVEELEDIRGGTPARTSTTDVILRLRADISAERDSQKGIVIGRGAA
jgi:GTPase Era involved in 16S rRNA processing